MKKFTVSALCCVAACALCLGGCSKNADNGDSCGDKAQCAEKSGCCQGKPAGECSKNKGAVHSQN